MRMDYSNEFRIRDTCLELLIEVQTYSIYISRKKKKKKKKELVKKKTEDVSVASVVEECNVCRLPLWYLE